MADIIEQLRLYTDTYNEKGYSSVNHISNALQTKSEFLSPIVTHLYGSDKTFGSKNFPLSFLSEGMNNIKSIGTIEYKYPVIGKPKKTSIIGKALYSAGDQPGIGRSKFTLAFADRWFSKSYTLISRNRVMVRVQEDPVQDGDVWLYKVQLVNPAQAAFCPLTELVAGIPWGRVIATVGIEASRGVEARSYSPGMAVNQLSLVRDTYKYRGNVQNKVMVIEINADGKTFKFWSEWELFLRNLEWKEKGETNLWHSEYNKDSEGVIHLVDEDSGEVVPMGAGLLQQIPNEDNYSSMTTAKLEQIVTDVMFNSTDATQVEIDVYTGTGGLREADRAMKAASSAFTLVDTVQVEKMGNQQGLGKDLAFGSYFSIYKHIDGHRVTFRHNPIQDSGVVADVSGTHPTDNLPTESFNMYFVDNSTYNGERNVQYVSEKGREDINFVVAGATIPMGYGTTNFRASDVDSASIEWMKSMGVCIKKPTNCFKVFLTVS